MTLGRYVVRTLRIGALLWLTVLASYDRSAAQVGHDPGRSPYRDVRRGAVLVVASGYFGGSRGGPGVGLSSGATAGLRYETALGGAIGASLGIAYAQTTRFIIDPAKDSATRKTGPFDTDVILADAGLQLNLTGRKTWHGFAPYLGGALGLAIGGGSKPDPSGYDFGTKITLAPEGGVRWYPARRISVRADARLVLWRLKYPVSYKVPNTIDNSTVLPPSASLNEWTSHPWMTIGLGWTF